MKWDEKIGWKKSIRFVKGDDKTLVANIDNGECIFVSNECLDIIEESISENLCFGELLKAIEDEDSRVYMKELIYKLYCLRVWKYEGEEIKSSMFEISLDITNKCNLRCKHCCVSAGEGTKEDLSKEEMKVVVEKILFLNPKMITISGGEPLVREDFVDVVNQIRMSYTGTLLLMTNATLIDDRMAKYIVEKFDAIDVSIDGADEKSSSILRGKGNFEKCINGISLLKKYGAKRISASMVVTKENQYSTNDFMKLCKKMGLEPMIRGLDDSGRAKNIYNEVACDVELDDTSMEAVTKSFEKNKMYKNKPQIFACQGAKTEFQIDYRGNIFPCGALMREEFILGNILDISDLKAYMEMRLFKDTQGYKNFEALKPYNINKCCDCDYNIFCFSCVNEIRKNIERNDLYRECDRSKVYYSLFWRNYESF